MLLAHVPGVDVTGSVPMRGNALPSLEGAGVDLVLAGHIHSYERSVLLDGHYGPPSSYRPACHALDASLGRYSSPYVFCSALCQAERENRSLVKGVH